MGRQQGESRHFGRVVERISFRGHPQVRSLHRTTIEVTTEAHLTERGDCIVGVAAERGCAGLSDGLKSALRSAGARVKIRISAGGESFEFEAEGDPGLQLSHHEDIVIRRSRFLSDRTLAVGASASAADLPRPLVSMLKNPSTAGLLEIEVETA